MLNRDLSYFLGLLIGGGKFAERDTIVIEFPFRTWPHEDVRISPEWFQESVSTIAPIIQQQIGANATPRYVSDHVARFYINIERTPQLLYDTLRGYGIEPIGILREHASISNLAGSLDADCRKRLLQGFADVIGSCRASHRNRTLQTTIVSFEILGRNYNLTIELCHLLYSLGIATDQILWNHPNMHAGGNPRAYWKKGNKVRVRAGDFARVGFGMECKRIGLERLLDIERNARGFVSHKELCPNRTYNLGPTKVRHQDEGSAELPSQLRRHFIHYTEICRAMGCPYAPTSWLDGQHRSD